MLELASVERMVKKRKGRKMWTIWTIWYTDGNGKNKGARNIVYLFGRLNENRSRRLTQIRSSAYTGSLAIGCPRN